MDPASADDAKAIHEFWSTQPVIQDLKADINEHGPIEAKTVEDVRKEPYTLPSGFEWSICDLNDEATLEEVYQLLYNHYVEDTDGILRFNYSKEFLKWALMPPGFHEDWIIGVRGSTGKKALFAFITGIPTVTRAHTSEFKTAEINFLCVHRKLRAKRLAPLLIKEVTRRVNLRNIWQAVYTAGTELPTPVTKARYWHRLLQPKKLLECRFSSKPSSMTLAQYVKLHRTRAEPQLGLRKMEERDAGQVARLLIKEMKKYKVCFEFTEEEVKHFLMPRSGVVSTYVKAEGSHVTDVVSYYFLPSTLLQNPLHNEIRTVYQYYTVANTVPLKDLLDDAIYLAKEEGGDVFNMLSLMNNESVMQDLKFGPGDGYLHYYLYNWKCPRIEPKDLGIILV